MKRECFLFKSSTVGFNKHIYIDKGNAREIYAFIKENEAKFTKIRIRILDTDFHYYDKYEKVKGYKNLTEMRFIGGTNGRIYCKEIKTDNGIFCIIMGKVEASKKTNHINKGIKEKLKVLNGYEYDL